jgi:hypothetical protein
VGALERAQADIDAGRLWKARDRLEGYLATDAHDQEALQLLGETCRRMGDLPAAGRYWYLTEDYARDEAAADAFEERRGGSAVEMLRELPVKPPLDRYPSVVRERLYTLVEDARAEGYTWDATVRRLSDELSELTPPPSRGSNAKVYAVVTALILLTVGVWVLGIVFLLQLVF